MVNFIQRNWSSVEMDQAIARAHRIGSEEHDSITVVDYVTPGTVEEAQLAALARKRRHAGGDRPRRGADAEDADGRAP